MGNGGAGNTGMDALLGNEMPGSRHPVGSDVLASSERNRGATEKEGGGIIANELEEGRTAADEQERPTASTGANQRQVGPVGGSSRDSLAGAGWTCREVGKFRGLVSPQSRPFSWLSPAPLWRSRNQIVGRLLGDPTNDERRRWMEIQRKAGKLKPNL